MQLQITDNPQKIIVRKAFTLIEILVVVAIIGVLATIIFISLDKAQARSRDSRRAADLDGLQVAMRLYALDKGQLPLNRANTKDGSTAWCRPGRSYIGVTYRFPGICLDELTIGGYLDKMPTDPKNSGTQVYSYYNYTKYAMVATDMEAPTRYGPFPYGWNCSDIVVTLGYLGGFWTGMECGSLTGTEYTDCKTLALDGNPATVYTPPSGTPLMIPGDVKRYCTGYLLQ